MIVGARTSPVQLLLSSVFRLNDSSNNIDWHGYEAIASHPAVAWSIPISLGDSHRGYRVVGTTHEYFEHLRYGRKQSLRMKEGAWFEDQDGCAPGAEAAEQLGYEVGDEIVVAHGAGEVSFIEHDEPPFKITGILAPTGTPVDRSVHVGLEGIDAIHAGIEEGHDEEDHDPLAAALKQAEEQNGDLSHTHSNHADCSHHPGPVTAFFVGLTAQLYRLKQRARRYLHGPASLLARQRFASSAARVVLP